MMPATAGCNPVGAASQISRSAPPSPLSMPPSSLSNWLQPKWLPCAAPTRALGADRGPGEDLAAARDAARFSDRWIGAVPNYTRGRAYRAARRRTRGMRPTGQRLRAPGRADDAGALDAVCAEVSTNDDGVSEDHESARQLLIQLEHRVCPTVPSQGTGPSAEEVATAIRAAPVVARAAAATLAGMV